jgi:hypothetical protein
MNYKEWGGRATISQSLEVAGECRLIKLATGVVEFPTIEMQEQARELGHIDLVLSQLPTYVLQELQMSMTQEMNSHAEKTSNELVKVTTENVALDMEYNKVKQEWDEAMQKVKGCNKNSRRSTKNSQRLRTEMEAPVEEQVTKIREVIQGFHTCIVDLEVCMTLSTPPKEREKREQTVTTIVESIKNLEVECAHLYAETTGIWMQLTKDRELQEINQKIQVV